MPDQRAEAWRSTKGREHVLPPLRLHWVLAQMVPTWVNASWRPVTFEDMSPSFDGFGDRRLKELDVLAERAEAAAVAAGLTSAW